MTPPPDCPERFCNCDPNDNSVTDAYDKYSIVIDAGSGHTSAHLFGLSPPNLPEQIKLVNDNRTILEFVNDTYVETQKLKYFLNSMIDKVSVAVPPCKLCQTPIFLGATAGMRLLNKTNPLVASKLMEKVDNILSNSSSSGNAKILNGTEEAGLSWVAANSMEDTSGSSHNKTEGALNLGWGSSEIAFECRDECENLTNIKNSEVLKYHIFEKDHDVLSKYNDCYGIGYSMIRFLVLIIWKNYNDNGKVIKDPIANPCLRSDLNFNNEEHNFPKKKSDIFNGYCTRPESLVDPDFATYIETLNDDYEFNFVGNWSKNACSQVVEELMDIKCEQIFNETCFDIHKPIPGVWDSSDGFIAMGHYNMFKNLLNITNDNNLSNEEVIKRIEEVCKHHTQKDERNCFAVNYAFKMLSKGYGFDAEIFTKFLFTSRINWPRGYVIIDNDY